MPRCSASISALESLENHVFGMSMLVVVSITILCSVSTSVIPVFLYTGRCHHLPAAIQPTTRADVLPFLCEAAPDIIYHVWMQESEKPSTGQRAAYRMIKLLCPIDVV